MPLAPPIVHPTRQRAVAASERAKRLGVKKKAAAEALGYSTAAQYSYFTQVLRGATVSEPVTSAVESYLDEVEAAQPAS